MRRIPAIFTAIWLSGVSGAALAQEQASPPNQDEASAEDTIVVSGVRGRSEDIQRVPTSITAFSSQQLQDAGVDQVDDFLAMTPGVTFANAQDAGTNFISIRGLSQTRNGEPPVAVVIDGVLQADGRSFDQPLFDVESIEVVRGPQGALYGRNATGGAILINTKKPTDELSGYVKAGIGRGKEYTAEASISGTLVPHMLKGRLSASYSDVGGYFDNLTLGRKADYGENFAIRGHLQFTPAPTVTIDLRGNVSRTDASSTNYIYQPAIVDPATGLPTAFDFTKGDANVVSRNFYANNLGLDNRHVEQFSLSVSVDMGFADFRSVSTYDHISESVGSDQFPYTRASTITPSPAFPFFDATQSQFFDVKAISQELRLTSKGNQPFRWMVGAYYLSTDRFANSSIMDDLEQGIIRIRRQPDINPTNPLTSFIADDNKNRAWALFANAAYDLTDDLELSVAGRYDRDRRKQLVDPRQGNYVNGVYSSPTGVPGAVNRAAFGEFQPKVTLRYTPSSDINLYATWGKGFRSGQFNQNGVGAIAASAGVLGVTDMLPKEVTTNYEAGLKLSLLDDRLTFNSAAFLTRTRNAPYFVFIGAVSAQVLVPIDKINTAGIETELHAKLTDTLSAYAALSLTDSKVKQYRVNPAAVGNKAPYIANSTINAGLQYRQPLGGSINLLARVDYVRLGKQYWDPENSTARSAVNLVNIRAGVETHDGWSLTGSIENVGGKVYNAEYVLGGFAFPAPPSIWRLTLRKDF